MGKKAATPKAIDVREVGKRFVRALLGLLFSPCNPFKSPFYVAGLRNSDRRIKLKTMQEQRETAQRNEDRANLRESFDNVRADNEYVRNQILKEQLRQQRSK
jgi:hypothetical protein